jgi:hypothetical protein
METDQQITTASEWKAKAAGTDLRVPSGALCRVRRVDLRIFVKQGRIPNSLRSIIDQAMGGKQLDEAEMAKEVMDNPEKLDDMVSMVDSVVVDCVLQPRVKAVPPAGQAKDPDQLYVDELDLNDKMYIFNWCVGGASDLEQFREEQETALGRIRAVAGAEVSAESTPGTD